MMGSINQDNLKQLEQFGDSLRKRDEFLCHHAPLKKKKKRGIHKKIFSRNNQFTIKKHRLMFYLRSQMQKLNATLHSFRTVNSQEISYPKASKKKTGSWNVKLKERKYQWGSVTILIRRRKKYPMKQQHDFDKTRDLIHSTFSGSDMCYGSSLFDIDISD